MKKKNIGLLLALVLIVGGVVGGTLAWLTAKTDPVVNTFTTSDINITLAETETNFKMIPGHTIAKDPKVTVLKGSEPAWLFVKLDKSTNFDDFMTYTIAEGWTELKENPGIYYRQVLQEDMGKEFSVLLNDRVQVKNGVTKEMMTAAEANQPTLTVTAYATQLFKSSGTEFTAAEAWGNISE